MKAKKDKVVKYAGGGAAAAAAAAGTAAATGGMSAIGGAIQLGLGAAQTAYGLYSAQKANREFQRAMAAAPSLETPGQFYENYRNAYDAEIARMETDAIQSNLATSVQALQGAGGRALVGGLSSAARTAQDAQNRMLAQERAMRMQAGQQLAVAEEREIGRKEARSVRQQQYANQAYQAAMGNIGAGIASAAEGAMYTDFSKLKPKKKGALGDAKPADALGKIDVKSTQALQEKLDIGDVQLQAIQAAEEAEVAEDFIGNLANIADDRMMQEAKDQKAGILPRLNTRFQGAKAMRQTKVGETALGSDAVQATAKQFSPFGQNITTPEASLAPIDLTPPATLNRLQFGQPAGSAVPKYMRDQQELDRIQNIARMSSMYKGLKYFEFGGMMTQGAFNHNTNPIDLVQNGQKVGEATGGEFIVNPNQAAAIAKESSYARKLFKRFEKNAKKKK